MLIDEPTLSFYVGCKEKGGLLQSAPLFVV